MSSDDVRRRVLDRARELFNECGIDNVGVRDLARDLGVSPGHLSYYFPRKEDLVRALMDELREHNTRAAGQPDTVDGLLTGLRVALLGQLEYRCLARSIVHVVDTWPELAARYREVDRQRRRALTLRLRALRDAGEVRGGDDDLARVVAAVTVAARFWMAEAHLSYPRAGLERLVDHYVALFAHALLPVATRPAKLGPWLDGLCSEDAVGDGPSW